MIDFERAKADPPMRWRIGLFGGQERLTADTGLSGSALRSGAPSPLPQREKGKKTGL